MPERAAPGWARWLVVSVAVVVLDLASKAWITHAFAPGETREITSFFSLVLVYNTGAAFSFLAGAGGWQRWFFTLLTVAISAALVVALRRPHASRVVPFALALVLGGALGNLWDRLTLGQVTDFILVHWGSHTFPAFNAADSAISVGVALLIWESVWPRRQPLAGQEKP
jgi:signal peptidase II